MRERELIDAFSFSSSVVQSGTGRHIGRWIFSLPIFVYIPAATYYIGSLFSLCIISLQFALRFRLSVITTLFDSLEVLGLWFAIFYHHFGYEKLLVVLYPISHLFNEQWAMSNPSSSGFPTVTSWTVNSHIAYFSYPESLKLSALAETTATRLDLFFCTLSLQS